VQIMQNLERNNIIKPQIEIPLRFLCAVAGHVSELLETINLINVYKTLRCSHVLF